MSGHGHYKPVTPTPTQEEALDVRPLSRDERDEIDAYIVYEVTRRKVVKETVAFQRASEEVTDATFLVSEFDGDQYMFFTKRDWWYAIPLQSGRKPYAWRGDLRQLIQNMLDGGKSFGREAE